MGWWDGGAFFVPARLLCSKLEKSERSWHTVTCKGCKWLVQKNFQMETALCLKFKVALIGKSGKYKPFHLCGYIVNARQWKTSKEKRI